MNITRWFKKSDGSVFKIDWQVVRTSDKDNRGYEIDGYSGKWLTVVSTFSGDANTNILSINPYNNPLLNEYEEITEEEANELHEQNRLAEEEKNKEEDKQRKIFTLTNIVDDREKFLAKQSKILEAVKNNVIYNGDLELMTALHNFTEESLEEDKKRLDVLKEELQELQSDNGQ